MLPSRKKDHGPVPIATFAVLPFLWRPKKGDKRSLGFVLVLPVSKEGQEEKESSPVPESPRKKSSPEKESQDQQTSRTLVSIGFVCFAICWIESVWEKQGQFPTEISSKEKEAREHFSLDHISKKTVSCVSRFPEYKTLLWAQAGEEKELIQKSKGRRKNMPNAKKEKELLSRWKKAVFWKRKRNSILQKPKNYKLKDQNQK